MQGYITALLFNVSLHGYATPHQRIYKAICVCDSKCWCHIEGRVGEFEFRLHTHTRARSTLIIVVGGGGAVVVEFP